MAEQEPVNPEQMNAFLFMQIVMMFQGAAFQHMGKVMNPATQKVERDLVQAKNAIDILGMLEEKTRGNLSEDEARLLEHTLYELRMNYVDEMNKDQTSGSEPEAAEGSGTEGEETEAPETEAAETEAEAPEEEKSEGEGSEAAETEAGESG